MVRFETFGFQILEVDITIKFIISAPSQPYRQHDQQLQHPPMEGYNHFSQRNYQRTFYIPLF